MSNSDINSSSVEARVDDTRANENNIANGIATNNEEEPLLKATGKVKNKISHRLIGYSTPTPIILTDEESRQLDPESGFQNRLCSIHKRYQNFLHNSKVILNVFIFFNSVWFVTTLITDYFFNIRIFFNSSNRYGNFNDLSLIFISIIANLLSLWFNRLGLYSHLDYTLNIILCLLTLFNLEVLYIVKYTRERIGLIGTLTYIFAAISFFIGVLLDWYLFDFNKQLYKEFSDNDDELRNANSNINDNSRMAFMKLPLINSNTHTLTEWFYIGIRNTIKILLLAYFIFFTLGNILTAWDLSRVTKNVGNFSLNAASYDAFHWIDKYQTYQIHIKCYGDIFNVNNEEKKDDQPIILYEHGGYDTAFLSANWIQELYNMNEIQKYCTYERPGYGLSDSAPAPESISMVADGLRHALVGEANITGPFLTVGYDLGALYSQVFTAKNLDMVKGMLLVEAWDEELLLKNYLNRLLPPKKDSDGNNEKWLPTELKRHNEFKLWLQGIWSTLGLKLQTSWLLAHHGSNDRIFGRDMKYQGKFLRTKFLESISSSMLSYRDVLNSKERLSHVRLSIVSSKEMIKKSAAWGDLQRGLTKISTQTKEWKIVDGGHEIYKYGLGKKQTQEVLLRLLGD